MGNATLISRLRQSGLAQRGLILAACAVILFLRKPDQWVNPQFWAEDGFFYHMFRVSGWATLLEPYAGYLHTLPRLIAGSADWWHPVHAPAWFVACAAATTLAICARAMSDRIPLAGGPWLAFTVVLVPDAFEVLLNVANAQWLVAAGLVLLLISRDARNPRETAHDVVTAVIGGLTGPFSVLLGPLFLFRAWQRRTRSSWLLAAIVGATAVVQVVFILKLNENRPPDQAIHVADGVGAVGTRLSGSLLAGGTLDARDPVVVRWIFSLATIAAVALPLLVRNRRDQQTQIMLSVAFMLLLAASLYRCRWVLPDLQNPGYGSRYFFPLQMILLWTVASALGGASRIWHWIGLGVFAWSLVVNVHRLREPALGDFRWADYAERIHDGEAVVVPINPGGWTIPLPARPR